LQIARDEYLKIEQSVIELSNDYGNDQGKQAINSILSQKPHFLNSNSVNKIREKTEELRSLDFMAHTTFFTICFSGFN
jgi:hypothetical protein